MQGIFALKLFAIELSHPFVSHLLQGLVQAHTRDLQDPIEILEKRAKLDLFIECNPGGGSFFIDSTTL